LRVKRFLLFLPLSLLAAGWLTNLAGCSLPAISPEQRAYSLVAGVNAVSRDVLADNFVPTIADYATLRDPTLYPAFWEQTLPLTPVRFPYVNAPYTVTSLDASNPAAVTLTLADNKGTWGPRDVILVMDRIGNDWFIRQMSMDPSPGPVVTVIVQ
jgi:hypothetical protein